MTQSKDPRSEDKKPLDHARTKTEQVQQDLTVAGAEIGLAREALDEHVPEELKQGDIAWAIGQNAAVERKLEQAADDLGTVTELLAEEAAERERLQQELARRG